MNSASKEKLIALLDEYRQQVVKHKGELFTIHFEDHDFSAKDYDRGLHAFLPGDKIFHQGFRHRPRKFVGTAVDHNKLTRVAAMLKAHPDLGGSNAAARAVMEAFETLKHRYQ